MKKQITYLLLCALTFLQCAKENLDPGVDSNCPNCPVITSINPTQGIPGDTILIEGRNFDRFGEGTMGSVTINGIEAIPTGHSTATQITVEVADSTTSGLVIVCTLNPNELKDNVLCSANSNEPRFTIVSNFSCDFEYTMSCDQFEGISMASEAINFMWDFGDGTTSSSEAPIHVYESPGSYNVELETSDIFGQTCSSIKEVVVNDVNTFRSSYDHNLATYGFAGCVSNENNYAFFVNRASQSPILHIVDNDNIPVIPPNSIWLNTISIITSIHPLSDGGYIAVGHEDTQPAGEAQYLFMRLDKYGNEVWTRVEYLNSTDVYYLDDVKPTEDGGFILNCRGKTSYRPLVKKLNYNGLVEWEYENIDLFHSVPQIEEFNSRYYLMIDIILDVSGEPNNQLMVELSSDGTVLQEQFINTAMFVKKFYKNNNNLFLVWTQDESTYISKVDTENLDILETNFLGNNSINDLHIYDDNSIVAAGSINNKAAIITGYDYEGNEQFTTTFDQVFTYGYCYSRTINKTADGGYFVTVGKSSNDNGRELITIKTDCNGKYQ